jgi:hypothetical protein
LTSANKTIQSDKLDIFISDFKTTTIIRFIVSLLLLPLTVIPSLNPGGFKLIFFIPTVVIFLTILVLRIIGGVIERNAWNSFSQFSLMQVKEYPFLYIGQNATEKLDNAALCEILSFLLVPMFIGWIYRMIGYFKLADFEDISKKKKDESFEYEPAQISSQPSKEIDEVKETEPKKEKFCPYCGEKLRSGAEFCGNCGTRLT